MATVTFLFTDIEGSTRLWDVHPEAMRHALASHDEIIRKEVDAAGGTVLKHTGDGAIAVFASAPDALDAAAEIQSRMSQVSHPDVGRLRLRMGVHTGEAEERDGDYFGPPLNRAARLMSVAHGGQVLVSLVTERLAGSEGAMWTLRNLGEYRLRDLARMEQVFQLDVAGVESDFPALSTPDLVPNNLPTQATSFVGRDQDLAEVTKLIRGARIVTVTGVGGAGKTRLVLQAAADIGSEFADGTWLVELASIVDPELIDAAAADVLGVGQSDGRTVRADLLDHLADKEALVIVDNCEHIVDAAADFVADIAAHTRNVRIVATSRELLGVGGEVAYGLRSLTMPNETDTVDTAEMLRLDAVRLFVERAQAAKPDFHLTHQTAPTVAEICRRLDGMPLALELAAARLRTFSPHQIAGNLDQRFRLLTGGSRTALPRQQTLSAAIDWSYRLLDEPERRLLQRLSVFQGGFTLEAVSEVCTDDDLDSLAVLELLPALVDKSLVAADVDADDARYRLLETLRQFARDRLDESGRADEFRRRHALFYRDLGVEAGEHIRGPDEARWWARIDTELDNLRQAMTWAMESEEPGIALETAAGFWRYWWFKSRPSEGAAWLERAMEAAGDDAPRPLLAGGLLGLGSLMEWSSRRDVAIAHLEKAVALWTELDEEGADRELLLYTYPAALINLSVAYQMTGRDESEVEALNERALAVAQRIDDPAGVAVALGNLAESAATTGDVERARDLLELALDASSALGSVYRLIELNYQIGLIELGLGSPERARRALQQALAYSREAELHHHIAVSEMKLAICDLDAGDPGAVARFDTAVAQLFANPDIRKAPPTRQETSILRADFDLGAGQLERAGRLVGASMGMDDAGSPPDWIHRRRRDRIHEEVVAGLGLDAAERAVDEGRALDEETVTALLLGDD